MKERENQSDRYEGGEGPRREGGVLAKKCKLKNSHTIWVHMTLCSRTHTFSNPIHLPGVHRGARCKRKTSERITSCLSVCLDARAMFMSGDTRKTNIKVREAGVCPSDR